MFSLDILRPLLYIACCAFISFHAAAMENKVDFLISNEYGKLILLKMEFEYSDDSGSSGEIEPILLHSGEQKPIVLQQLLIKNSETTEPANLALINLKHIIVSAWVPGSELNNVLREPAGSAPEGCDKDKTQLHAGWNPLSSGWNMLTSVWGSFRQNANESESSSVPETVGLKAEEVHPYERLEGCAALVFVNYINLIRIVVDPLRDLPTLSGEKVKLNGFH